MPYVKRDAEGRLEAVFRDRAADAEENLPAGHPELVSFIAGAAQPGDLPPWLQSDLAMARVVEDLIDLLIRKKLISFVELPLVAQQKIILRHGNRDDIDYVAELFPVAKDEDLAD
jgi:hypothetical protein